MRTMNRVFGPRVAVLIAMCVMCQSMSFAADTRIALTSDGPSVALKAAGKSICFLNSLRTPAGEKLNPSTVRHLDVEELVLPDGSQENCLAFWDFIRAEREAYGENVMAAKKPAAKKVAEAAVTSSVMPPPSPKTLVKNHPAYITTEKYQVKVGETRIIDGFADENNMYHDADGEMSVPNVVVSKLNGKLELKGLASGVGKKATVVMWLKSDPKVRKIVTVEVFSADAPAAGRSLISWKMPRFDGFLIFLICLVMLGLGLIGGLIWFIRGLKRSTMPPSSFMGSSTGTIFSSPTPGSGGRPGRRTT